MSKQVETSSFIQNEEPPSSGKLGVPDGDAKNVEAVEEEEEEGVTMVDVLKDEEELEEESKAVLGCADDKNCSYMSGGYMKRQALYACLTCNPKGSSEGPSFLPSGICLACSYHCHDNHDIVELYTKRRFRCDCGNRKRLPHNPCRLEPEKAPENEDNRYDQNFSGVYCTCHRPYPDPEDSEPDQMIQCIFCEDWYHSRHLELGTSQSAPSDDDYHEMICHICAAAHYKDFLHAYAHLSVMSASRKSKDDADEETVNITADDNKHCLDVVISKDDGGGNEDAVGCVLNKKVKLGADEKPGALFMVGGWRDRLCRCASCRLIYKERKVDYLLDPEDTVHHYEENAKRESGSQYEEGMKALSEMDRVQQVEAIQGYNNMKSDLMEYLRKFASNGKVVRPEDIKEFFQEMSANKRRKIEIPKFCK